VVAPDSYESRYISLQVKFNDSFYLYLPKVSIAPKLVFESIKTNLAYGTLSGTASNAKVGTETTSIAILQAAQMTVAD
jgi:hypothetical protein